MLTTRIISAICLTLFFCVTRAQTPPVFSLLSPKQTNVDFVNLIRENNTQHVLAYEYLYNGGGVAIGDINNDGLPDICFTGNMVPNKLYLNLGNCRFRDITRQAGIAGHKGWKTGLTMADVNGDGLLDIYICYSGKIAGASRRNQLFINQGNLVFKDQASVFGLDDEGCSTQAIFFDYDIDGDLDMYLLNHNVKAYRNVELHHLKTEYDSLAADKLFRNENGVFKDVSVKAGISGNPISFGLGVAVSDVNNDGWPDIYVSNDYAEQDYLYINNANGSFTAKEHFMLSHLSQFSMGSDLADINNDGFVDIFTLDMLPEDNRRQKLLQSQENYELHQQMAVNGFHYQFMRNMLHLNNGNGTFSEIGQLAGISNTDWSWSALFADLDNDGNKDLYVTNGYMRDYTNRDFLKYWGDYLVKQVVKRDSVNYFDIVQMMPSTLLSNYAFKNNGNLGFINTTNAWGLQQHSLSNGAAYADLDRDGDLDLVVNNINTPAFIYRNETRQQRVANHISVRLKGTQKNTQGLGAKIYCYANGSMQLYEQMPTRGYQSSVSEVVHIGLGTAEKVDSLKIIWLNGAMQLLREPAMNTTITVEQKDANSAYVYSNKSKPGLFTAVRPFIDYTHVQLEYNDFKRQPLMPVMQSNCGPAMATGDLNGDGLDDILIGSSQGQAPALYIQQPQGNFLLQTSPDFTNDNNSQTTSVLLADLDGDRDLDAYMTSGGYNDYEVNDVRFQDRLFINDGKGSFSLDSRKLPHMFGSKSSACSADVDGDGDLDLFIAGRLIPGRYPEMPASFLLLNNGQGQFHDVTSSAAPALQNAGMITDAVWKDFNGDKRPDLLIVGEWMQPTIFLNLKDQNGDPGFVKQSTLFGDTASATGWWNAISMTDVDSDGDDDLILGNWGLNSQIKASVPEPAELICADFDNNGSLDPLLCFFIQGKSYPYVSRDELLDQLYPLRRKFTSYKSYADASIEEIFSKEELKGAMKLKATQLQTMLLINENGQFIPRAIPIQAQFAPVYKIVDLDVNGDGSKDLLLLGNNDYPRLKIGKMDACFGTLLINDGKGNFRYVSQYESGLRIAGDARSAVKITVAGKEFLIVGINNSPLTTYRLDK